MTVIITVGKGEKRKIIAKASSDTITVPLSGGAQGLSAVVSSLKRIDNVIQVNLTTDPPVDASLPQNLHVERNTVGTTIVFGAGTTVSAEFVVIGY